MLTSEVPHVAHAQSSYHHLHNSSSSSSHPSQGPSSQQSPRAFSFVSTSVVCALHRVRANGIFHERTLSATKPSGFFCSRFAPLKTKNPSLSWHALFRFPAFLAVVDWCPWCFGWPCNCANKVNTSDLHSKAMGTVVTDGAYSHRAATGPKARLPAKALGMWPQQLNRNQHRGLTTILKTFIRGRGRKCHATQATPRTQCYWNLRS